MRPNAEELAIAHGMLAGAGSLEGLLSILQSLGPLAEHVDLYRVPCFAGGARDGVAHDETHRIVFDGGEFLLEARS